MVRRGDDGEPSALPNVDRFSRTQTMVRLLWVGSIAAALLKQSKTCSAGFSLQLRVLSKCCVVPGFSKLQAKACATHKKAEATLSDGLLQKLTYEFRALR
jgi:hypothetical protein